MDTIVTGNRMFSFQDEDVDFYLPQLCNMYIHMHDVAEAIHPYMVHRYVFGSSVPSGTSLDCSLVPLCILSNGSMFHPSPRGC